MTKVQKCAAAQLWTNRVRDSQMSMETSAVITLVTRLKNIQYKSIVKRNDIHRQCRSYML